MRAVLAVEGTRGDVFPMLALARWLGARGHDVMLCAPPDFAGPAAAAGVAFHPVGATVRDFLAAHADVLAGRPWRVMREGARYLAERSEAQLSELDAVARGADLVVAAGLQLMARSVAEAHGIPYRYVAYCPVLLPSARHTPHWLGDRRLRPWANRLAWRLDHGLHSLGLRGCLARGRARLGLPPVRDVYTHLLGAPVVLAADAALAPLPDDVPHAVEAIPCLHPDEGEPLPEKLQDFLAQGPPPVYFGFGSMTDPDPDRTTRLVLEVVERLGCRALVSRGWAGLGEGALPEGVSTVGAVSHPRLFARCAAVVHHGGAGTTTTAARAGVPQIVVPHVADQFYWGQRVSDLGLGPPAVPRRTLDTARLTRAVASVLGNEWVQERATELAARLRADLPAGMDRATELFEAAAHG